MTEAEREYEAREKLHADLDDRYFTKAEVLERLKEHPCGSHKYIETHDLHGCKWLFCSCCGNTKLISDCRSNSDRLFCPVHP
jgi:hypothetical protein